jgi:hypothetical protein
MSRFLWFDQWGGRDYEDAELVFRLDSQAKCSSTTEVEGVAKGQGSYHQEQAWLISSPVVGMARLS